MKTTKHYYSVLTLIVFAILFYASATVQPLSTTLNTYVDTKKQDENIVVSYSMPVIKATAKTTQMQTKDGVTITVEVMPFTVNRLEKEEKSITYKDPEKSGYDVYEVSKTPYYSINPENVHFKIRIRNNEDVPLKLSEVGFALIIDGTQWSFPTGYLDDWNKGLILTGFDKEYVIKGPQIAGLNNAQLVYIFLNGVPTSYNDAGNVIKKSNFEWYFECKSESIQTQEKRMYTYEISPIYKEKCSKCNGTGVDPQVYKCSSCDGKGSRLNQYDGKTYTCNNCKGTGKVYYRCNNCDGGGILYYPKSKDAPIASSITWKGAVVEVKTNPPGAMVSVVNIKTKEYESVGMSNVTVDWYSSNEKLYPIMVKYQDQKVKVLPYDKNGKLIGKIEVNMIEGKLTVVKGRLVE